MRGSELDDVAGVGPKRKAALLKTFQSMAKIRAASMAELREVLPENAAGAVYRYFHPEE